MQKKYQQRTRKQKWLQVKPSSSGFMASKIGTFQLLQTIRSNFIKGINFSENDKLDFCEGCVEGKMSQKPFKSVGGIKTTRQLQIVHSDVCGPIPVQSFTGKLYFVTFIDDYSRCVKV